MIGSFKKWMRDVPGKVVEVKPSFMIIGAQKCGTTSLFNTLDQHSQMKGSRPKELAYFSKEGYKEGQNHRAYHGHFRPELPFTNRKLLRFEATPIYLYHPDVPRRLHAYNSALKLIIVLRDPAKRALSAWNMYHKRWEGHPVLWEKRSFSEVIDDALKQPVLRTFVEDGKGIVERGVYHDQLKNYFKYFDRSQILVLSLEELIQERERELNKVFQFLEVPYEEMPLTHRNAKTYQKQTHQPEIERLRAFYAPHNEALYELLGRSFNW